MVKIMIVEDDPKIAELLSSYIEKYGYQAIVIVDFQRVLDIFSQEKPELVLLDINLPSFDGYYWCRQIRAISTCPILFISAREGTMDQVMALENGGDDYIPKPFHYEVVMAKVRSQLRRAYGDYAPKIEERMIEQQGLTLFPERLVLQLRNQEIDVTRNEAILLEMLMKNYPRVVSREVLLNKLWDSELYVDDNTLSVNTTRVRKKLQALGIQGAIETIRSVGYRLHITWEIGGEK
ncbi:MULTISPECIES: response regulator transcription factor [Bacillus]|uniref:response regulator transcription factor n=1 Tax=Bacillus TaxID=1386 RepID=UPI0001A14BFC|nr:response regulator transcription factor [Bacillus pseudomycoides]EEM16757.1 DNA-binding response regulator [Bacillus pseudomycoides DSM 12442]MED1594594.1 response regulator transcription factor [Bacillus pseudomycoides]MED4713139.1 response regulator transcription factor [Bacillus pseudomycoides]OOR48683.1 DNA-binding response regulator [Bacillus pseudomycoides]PDY11293.1 DNA-binding response regulator [Bacillus pseudomycoides]